MKNRIIALLALVALAATLIVPAFADIIVMYVYTDNGKPLKVRDQPNGKVIGRIPYGGEVNTISEHANHWMEILYNGETAFVMSRYLVDSKPDRKPTPTTAPEKSERERQFEEMNRELKTLRTVEEPFFISARPSRPTGWVNFRVGPSSASSRISKQGQGKQLQVVGETSHWYQAIDPETNQLGFIHKNFVTALPKAMVSAATEQLGTLNVNGQFMLQCKLPAGYVLQSSNIQGARIIANLMPTMAGKPVLNLTIAHSELYADVERLNDMTAEDLAMLERSFSDMNDVTFTYTETAHGTKLLVVREVGADTDFVDIVTFYKGYSIEFVMSPNRNAADQTLTDAQVQMCVDFLSDLDFVPVA